ncbi:MAG: type IV pili methyl-accepting chemotaxis transducer N-terminal domain-containing protein, partial [Acidiferrobacterales bacterium]|nr:type IV pili methyl-accepting chemotaxis transducer N-terminal domain-containing protein [Acidiferrobacterales bacterium]
MAIVKLPRARQATSLERPSEEIVDLSAEEIQLDETGEYVDIEGRSRSILSWASTIGRLPVVLPALGVGLVLSIIGAVWLLYLNGEAADRHAKYIEQSSQLLMLSQRLAKDAREAVRGEEGAFRSLKTARDRFDKIINTLRSGNAELGIGPSPDSVKPALDALTQVWSPRAKEGIRGDIDQILDQKDNMVTLRKNLTAINERTPVLMDRAVELAEVGQRTGLENNILRDAIGLQSLGLSIAMNANIFAQGTDAAAVAATQMGKDIRSYRNALTTLSDTGSQPLRIRVDTVRGVFDEVESSVLGIIDHAPDLIVSQRASSFVFKNSNLLLNKSEELVDAYGSLVSQRAWMPFATIVLAVL